MMNKRIEKAYAKGTDPNKTIAIASRYINNKYVFALPDVPLSTESRETIRKITAADMTTGALLMKPIYIGTGIIIGTTLCMSVYGISKVVKRFNEKK